jgi:hypothetical protein
MPIADFGAQLETTVDNVEESELGVGALTRARAVVDDVALAGV